MQGFGSLLSVIVVILCLKLGGSKEFCWRFALAFGAVPVLIAFPWRLQMHETESFRRVNDEREKVIKRKGTLYDRYVRLIDGYDRWI